MLSASRLTAPRLKSGFWTSSTRRPFPSTAADEICRYLKEKYILCSGEQRLPRPAAQPPLYVRASPCFDHVFVSESLGYRKPEKAFFDACRAFLPDVAADECMMIGDSLTADITGGKNAGMKTIWYNHTHRPVPERCEADQIVESLSELKNLL